MNVTMEVLPRFESYIYDWDYTNYIIMGSYGSGKSHQTAVKIILKCLKEQRKVLVVREVFETIRESCFDLFYQILTDLDLIDPMGRIGRCNKVIARTSPLQFIFPNGSRIIFKGMDKPMKLKSLNGVSIVWLEEAPEIKYEGYKELIGRIRHPSQSVHFILTFNPVDINSWVYDHFFIHTNEDGSQVKILNDDILYKRKTCVVKDTYYHHSTTTDNLFLPQSYVRRLDDMIMYDPDLYRVARLGRFGVNGIRVLPQFVVAPHNQVIQAVKEIPEQYRFNGMDFGFEESYNALIRCAVDVKNMILYIYFEYYKNHMTDDKTVKELLDLGFLGKKIIADCAEPKTIQYYKNNGIRMRKCHKSTVNGEGSRIQNTKKIKRFHKIICSANCTNTIRELNNLTYAKDKNGKLIYDEFNIDPHTFSAIWYALDTFNVPNIKERNTKAGVKI